MLELPPRARRIRVLDSDPGTGYGTTSACAENTRAPGLYPHQARNYLRVRGEYQIRKNVRCPASELPPRARRILGDKAMGLHPGGTTSACAENTVVLQDADTGESELPPRARRIRITIAWGCSSNGTTSACAENTSHQQSAPALPRNYLRVRGEYGSNALMGTYIVELPPRARRIPPVGVAVPISLGTTSACAENTRPRCGGRCPAWNYLRVRGEYSTAIRNGSYLPELPPRARRIQIKININKPLKGTTSACAENTSPMPHSRQPSRNYLRVRGEYKAFSLPST